MSSTPPPMPAPKFATRRDPSRPTLGTRQGAFADIWFGRQWMPHQQLVADVAGELRPNGLPYYSLVVCTMQRRAGKTDLSFGQTAERSFSRRRFLSWYTAQTGSDAQDNFLKFVDNDLAETPLLKVVRVRRGNGHADMRFPNSSLFRPHPPTEAALHGKDADRNDIDEAWAFTEDEGKALMQAISPTHLTRPGAQTFIWSAGGTAASTWLAKLVAQGRAGADQVDDFGRMAYFEWGIPDDLSIDDTEAIANHHPAYGRTITLEALEALRADLDDDAEFARAAGNRWTEVIGGVISSDQWRSLQHADHVPDHVPVGYGCARAGDGSQVVIASAAQVDEDLVVVEILDVLPTSHRAAEHVAGWAADGPVAPYPSGASAKLRSDLEDLNRPIVAMTVRELTAATATIEDAIGPRTIRFRPHPALDAAVLVAGKRRVQSGGWVWAHTGQGQIAALEAATAAVHALRPKHRPAVETQPALHFGSSAA